MKVKIEIEHDNLGLLLHVTSSHVKQIEMNLEAAIKFGYASEESWRSRLAEAYKFHEEVKVAVKKVDTPF